jgi:hypothetical protein
MVDLYETNDPKYAAQIDGVGWIFVAFAVVIAATAAITNLHRTLQDRAVRDVTVVRLLRHVGRYLPRLIFGA